MTGGKMLYAHSIVIFYLCVFIEILVLYIMMYNVFVMWRALVLYRLGQSRLEPLPVQHKPGISGTHSIIMEVGSVSLDISAR